jgi:hypothetical protein
MFDESTLDAKKFLELLGKIHQGQKRIAVEIYRIMEENSGKLGINPNTDLYKFYDTTK